jgi:hypothetical protein
MLDIVYNKIIVTPKIELATTPYGLWCIAANIIHKTNATIPSTAPANMRSHVKYFFSFGICW